jgi:adenylate kinase
MTCLDSLQVKLLCEIIQHVRSSFHIVSHKYHNIAKDMLYQAPKLLTPKRSDTAQWNYRRRHQMRGLLKVLINQPQLARQVRKLKLTIIVKTTLVVKTTLGYL